MDRFHAAKPADRAFHAGAQHAAALLQDACVMLQPSKHLIQLTARQRSARAA
jgi:hypothetical protein